MKTKIVFDAFLKPSAQVDFTLLPEGWEELIGGTSHEFATGVSRYYEGLKIVLSSVACDLKVYAFLSFIHPCLRHDVGDVLGFITHDNKQASWLVYTNEKIMVVTNAEV